MRVIAFQAAALGERLDKLIAAAVPEISRTQAQRLIEDGHVEVAGRPARRAADRLEAPAEVRVHLPEPAPAGHAAEAIPLQIIYEDADLIVIDKPAGMVVHPAPGHAGGTLVNAVLGHDPDLEGVGDEQRPGLVHRLDKDTSGLIVVAKHDRAHRELQRQFHDREVDKRYLALVDSAPPTEAGRIEAAIGRDLRDRKKMAIVPAAQGRAAITEYAVRERFAHHTLLDCRLLTGRTHQIRLHLAYLKCPIVGDTVYGRRSPSLPVARQCLHAWQLSLSLPASGERCTFTAPVPADLEQVLETLRK
ncbi:MAG: RluA family pseudouridine synthase [Anaerolineales bacterium]|nr:RluA family pseudouridine synthase [Anaerolineales bacterium]